MILIALVAGLLVGGSYLLYLQFDRGCADADCFVEAVQACEPETFRTQSPAGTGAEGVYRVVGPAGPACEISFEYSENPNPTFVDKPVTFVLSPDEASEDTVLGALEACMTGRTGPYQCGGPLFDQLAGSAPAYASLEYGGDGPLPCGDPVEGAGEPLYPMPKDGQWGYVTRDGEWQIQPQWDRAMDFHEGRAIVGGKNAWGIIDRDGEEIIAPEHASDVDGQPPFTPYSEGCTVANIFTDTSQPAFFLDRDGKAYWRDERPEALAALEIKNFGNFSEGLAWFWDGDIIEPSYGWIDASGSVAIEPEFVDAGDFSGGLAPASSREGQAGFISPDGRLVLPRKWTLHNAQPFSEGLAQVWTDAFDIAYMNDSDFAFHDVTFPAADGSDPVRGQIEAAGPFHDGLAPVVAVYDGTTEFAYMNQQGEVAFVPDRLDGIALCDARLRPEFHNGLVRLVVADDGESCGDESYLDGAPAYDAAHYLYLDTQGRVAMQQVK
ncbi:WG containing repeat-containing protein [Salinihabitans flavidus]|uniref:WG containing repeat-containing protein n=1 Tax=Salinihabitans flavidus TaxID=569882 RepID=A0A1H8T311_9RHOB|nr:WG repeat-containing protein [Salinihabitans flavidus]SEO84908.1 WG containing repeat-containing protein [Salinihabitans flavidus]